MADQETGLTSWDHIEGIPDPAENRHLVGHRATLDLLAARQRVEELALARQGVAAKLRGHLTRPRVGRSRPGSC